jgi:hypothetical protein
MSNLPPRGTPEYLRGAAKNLAQHVGPGMWDKTRGDLVDLSHCGDAQAEAIARDALQRQSKYDDDRDSDSSDHE